ncbi:MAG TPA: porin family protein [Chitinophagaceae bacterium]|nr:porin family protein [Chitinophagaceae bacterium]
MKTNKVKFLSGVAALLISASSMAQTTMTSSAGKPASVQIRAGVNFQNLNGEANGDDLENKLLTTFHAGVEVPIMIAPEFYIQPGAIYSMKGAKDEDNSDMKTQISYIEVPVNFVYKPMLGMGNLILGVGPYMGVAIGGKVKDDNDDVDITFKNDLSASEATEFGLGKPFMRRLDFGGNLLAGYQFSNGLFFQLNAQLGMTNLLPKIEGETIDNSKVKNTGFGVSVGYAF